MSSLDQVVRELRRAASRTRAARYGVHALAGALVWVAGVLLVARVIPFDRRAPLALIGIAAAALLAGLAWLVRRPTAGVLMAIADLRLGLKERLSTAWERRHESGPLDPALRQDALRRAESAKLASAFPIRVNRGEASLIAILAIFALGLSVLPNPMDQVLAQRRADQASQARAAKALSTAQKKVATTSSPSPKDAQVQKILQDTQTKIREATGPRQALESITPAQQQLQRLSDPGTPALSSSAQNLANALSGTAAGRNAAQAISSSPAQGAQAVRNLGSQLQNLSPQDRQQLAQALGKASQQAQNSQMRDSLSQASSALQSGGTGGTGSQGSGSGSGSGTSSTERVYVPGQPVPGQTQNDPTPLGPGQDVPLTPYNQVIQGYQQAAQDATDQSLIPGSERDLIHQYFSQLGEPNQGGS